MRKPKLRELKEAIKALIKGPYTERFPFKPFSPMPSFRGKPEYSQKECIGCTACVQVCPAGALSYVDEGNIRSFTHRSDTCIFCGQCEANCPTTKGITLTKEFDLATTGKREDLKHSIEKELIRCLCCNEIIAPIDQILWVARKIGSLLFSNTSMMIYYLNIQNLAQLKDKSQNEQLELRADRFNLLCPKCRRETVIKS